MHAHSQRERERETLAIALVFGGGREARGRGVGEQSESDCRHRLLSLTQQGDGLRGGPAARSRLSVGSPPLGNIVPPQCFNG